jgi:hypothetical protein
MHLVGFAGGAWDDDMPCRRGFSFPATDFKRAAGPVYHFRCSQGGEGS